MLGVAHRTTLDLPNRRLFDTFEARVALAKEIRRHRPRLVIGLGGKTSTASPDHYQASLIIEAAVFYSKLTKWDEHFDGLPPHVVPRRLECFLAFHTLSPTDRGATMVVDIGDTLEKKLAAIACYASQFPPTKGRLSRPLSRGSRSSRAWPPVSPPAKSWPARPSGAPAT